MPDEPTQPDPPTEGGDLTARLKKLEAQVASEAPAPARRRKAVTPPIAVPVKPSSKPSTKPSTKPAVEEPVAAEPVEPAPPGPVEPESVEPESVEPEPVVEAVAAPVLEPEAEPVAETVAEPDAEPVAEPVVSPAAAPPVKRPAKKAVVPGVTPAKKAAAKKAPAAKAPAKKAPAKTAPAEAAPAKAPAVKRPPAKKVAAPEAAPLTLPPAPPAPVAAPRPPAVPKAPATSPSGQGPDGLVRFLVVLAVLLLAVAAGLGAAALVEHRDSSFRSGIVVELSPGPDPTGAVEQAVAQGVSTYVAKASSHEFTVNAAQRALVAGSAVTGDVTAKPHGTKQVQLDVFGGTASEARDLAIGAGDALVELVNEDQAANQSSAGDRLSAEVVSGAQAVTKESPKDRDAWIAGGLAAAAVLVLSGVAVVLRLTRRS